VNLFEKELIDIPFTSIKYEVQRLIRWNKKEYERTKTESEKRCDPFLHGLLRGRLMEIQSHLEDLQYLLMAIEDSERLKEESIQRYNLISERRDV